MKACQPKASRAWKAVARLLLVLVAGFPATSPGADSAPQFELPTGKADFWTPRESARDWTCIACSDDGRRVIAGVWDGRLFLSPDFGVTWSPRDEARRWRAVASSADGQRLVAVVADGRIHLSDDGGETWIARENPRKWSAVTSSADGRLLAAAVAGGRIHTSTDAGHTWTPRATDADWRGIASSADGRRLTAVAYLGHIHTSTDAGLTWSAHELLGAWAAVASSADGTTLAAAEWNNYIHVSTNGGASWVQTRSNPGHKEGTRRHWQAVCCSADGEVISAVDAINPLFTKARNRYSGHASTSANRGATWDLHAPMANWSAIASSADGQRLVAASRNGRVFTLERTTSRHSLLAPTGSGPLAFPRFAISIPSRPGSPGNPEPRIRFRVIPEDQGLFLAPPEIAPDGTLTFATGNREGATTVAVVAQGGEDGAGNASFSSVPQTFSLVVQGRSFRSTQWTDDASTGISRDATLWAWRTGEPAAEEAVINGVPVPLAAGPRIESLDQFTLEGPDFAHADATGKPVGIEGRGSLLLAGSYVDNGDPAVIKLQRLVPGRPYTLHVLGVAHPASYDLVSRWSANGTATDIDEQEFGIRHGIRVSHDFVPTDEQYEIQVTPHGPETWAFCGLALNAVAACAILEQPTGAALPRGGTFDFGSYPPGLIARRTFTLRNGGVVPLKELRLTVEGAGAGEFTITAPPGATIPGGDRSSFEVEFRPTGIGARTALLRLSSNEPEPFTLRLVGIAQSEAEIPVRELPDLTMDEDRGAVTVNFPVDESVVGREFTLAGTSSEPNLVPPDHILCEGAGRLRRLTVKPAPDRFGTALIQVLASDGSRSTRSRFTLTVRPVNDPPRFEVPPGVVTPVGIDWTLREGTARRWRAFAASHDGQRLAAAESGGRIHTSTNSGMSWTPRDSGRPWIALASSTNGVRLAAAVANGPILVSADSGATWIERWNPRAWSGLASSADGLRLAAVVDGGPIYLSTNAGTSWAATAENRFWHAIASSADGRTLAAAVDDGPIHVSADGGATWVARGDAHSWTAIAASADGSVLAATTWDGPVFISQDRGETWIPRTSDRFWRAVSCSADGQRIVAAETLGRLHLSFDAGKTWAGRGDNRDWTAVSWSGDGECIAAAAWDGPVSVSASHMTPYRLAVHARSGVTQVRGFVTQAVPGPDNERGQHLRWQLTTSDASLFATAPSVDEAGTLSLAPSGRVGVARMTLTAQDDGGRAWGGSDMSQPKIFEIELSGPEPK